MTALPETPTLRRDAARNRGRILAAADRLRHTSPEPLQLNAVARVAEVGVGTVYRHFPTVAHLNESLVADHFGELRARADEAAVGSDPATAVRGFLHEAFETVLGDELFAAIAVGQQPQLETTLRLRNELLASVSALFDAAEASVTLPAGMTSADALELLCAVAHALGSRPRTPEKVRLYVDALLDGLLRPHGVRSSHESNILYE